MFIESNLISSVVTVIFYILIAAFVIYSMIAIYDLLKYGRSKILGLSISLIYLLISLAIYIAAVINLNGIK